MYILFKILVVHVTSKNVCTLETLISWRTVFFLKLSKSLEIERLFWKTTQFIVAISPYTKLSK